MQLKKGIVPIQVEGIDHTRVVVIPHTRRRGGRTTPSPEWDGPATGEDREPNPRPEGPGRGGRSRPAAERSRLEQVPPAPERPAGGGGITPSGTSTTEEVDEEEADALAKRKSGQGKETNPRHFLLEWDPPSHLDKCLWRCSEGEDSVERSLQPAKPVMAAAPAGESPPGSGHTRRRTHGGGYYWHRRSRDQTRDPAPEAVAAETQSPQPHPTVHRGPDRLRTAW